MPAKPKPEAAQDEPETPKDDVTSEELEVEPKELVKLKVIGLSPVTGADGEAVPPGGTVELDPDVVNVDALLRAGSVAVPGSPADPAAKSKE